MKVKAVVFDRDEQISIREVGLPELQPNQIRTETLPSLGRGSAALGRHAVMNI